VPDDGSCVPKRAALCDKDIQELCWTGSFVYKRVTLEFADSSSNTHEKSKAFRFTLCVLSSWEAGLWNDRYVPYLQH
jgi:hypothetical protein